jgi:hypothetical protein
VRQAGEPFAEEGVYLGVAQAVTDALGGLDIRTGKQAVVHGLESDAAVGQLALQIFMAVEAKLGRIREIGAELEEEGAEVLVAAVEVIDVDHGGGINDPGDGAAAGASLAGGAGHADLLLGDADKEDAFLLFEVAQFLLEDVVLALALLEADQLQALTLDERIDGLDESLSHGDRLFSGGKAVPQISTAKGRDAGLAGELRDVGVQIHPVDAFEFHDDVIFLEFSQAVGYFHSEFRLGICCSNMEQPPLVGNIPAPPGAATPSRTHRLPEMGQALNFNEAGPQTGKAIRGTTKCLKTHPALPV